MYSSRLAGAEGSGSVREGEGPKPMPGTDRTGALVPSRRVGPTRTIGYQIHYQLRTAFPVPTHCDREGRTTVQDRGKTADDGKLLRNRTLDETVVNDGGGGCTVSYRPFWRAVWRSGDSSRTKPVDCNLSPKGGRVVVYFFFPLCYFHVFLLDYYACII
jgi:hypothetical protein